MDKIYIFGHKKPDTDSITASIALSYLKKQLGINTEARTLGDVNNETKFVLNYFNIEEPRYLNDVKLQIKDTNYLKEYYIDKNASIYNGFLHMQEHNIGILPLVDQNNIFSGLVSMKDIAKYQMNNDLSNLRTSYANLLDVLEAESLLKFDDEIDIRVIAASYRSTTFIENINIDNTMGLVVGDRHSIIEYAVNNSAKLIILTGDSIIKEEHLEIARLNHVNVIKTKLDTFTTSRKIWLANYLYTIKMEKNVICLLEDDTIEEVLERNKKIKYSNYPILNKKYQCLGLIRMSDIDDANRKKVILVDHNEPEQSVDGLEDANILEIIDHHKIGSLGTSMPINFRNMPVGSSNTIIYSLYKENHVEIPKQIAGLMLSGIISDTLLFKSPTTTEIDKDVVKKLSEIAGINYEEYGIKMLKAGASTKGKSKEDILFTDFKNFTIDGKKIGIGQITTFDIEEYLNELNAFVDEINKISKYNDYHAVALFVTDIMRNGSYIFYSDDSKELFEMSFDIDNIYEGYYLDNIISRKKQIIPKIMDVIEK